MARPAVCKFLIMLGLSLLRASAQSPLRQSACASISASSSDSDSEGSGMSDLVSDVELLDESVSVPGISFSEEFKTEFKILMESD